MNSVKGNRMGEKKRQELNQDFISFFFFFLFWHQRLKIPLNLSLCGEECKKGEMYLTRRFTPYKRSPQGYFGGRCPEVLALQKSRWAWKSLLHEYMICRRQTDHGLIFRTTWDMSLKVRLHFYSPNSLWYMQPTHKVCPLIYCCCVHGATFTNPGLLEKTPMCSSHLRMPIHKGYILHKRLSEFFRSSVHYLTEQESVHSGNIKMFYSLSSADSYFSSTLVIELIHLYIYTQYSIPRSTCRCIFLSLNYLWNALNNHYKPSFVDNFFILLPWIIHINPTPYHCVITRKQLRWTVWFGENGISSVAYGGWFPFPI